MVDRSGWQRNLDGIKGAAQKKRQEAFDKTEEAIKRLIREKRPINFESVAEAAGVTRAWLYKQPELRGRIETLRAQRSPKKQVPPEIRSSDASKTALIAELRQQNKQLRAQVQELKRELELAYGRAFGTDDLEAQNRELQKQNQHLFRLLTEARAEIDERNIKPK